MDNIRRFFQPPEFGEPNLNRRAKLLRAIFLVLLVFSIAFEIFFLISTQNWLGKVVGLVVWLIALVGFQFLRKGRLELAATWISFTFWMIMMLVISLWSGISGAASLGQLLIIFMGGLLVNERIALLLAVLTIVGNYGVMLIETSGSLPFEELRLPLPQHWVTQSFFYLIAVAFTQAYARNIRSAMADTQWNEQVLKDRVDELRQAQAQLEMSDQNLRRREAILESVGIAAEKLFRGRSFGESVQQVLKDLGQATGVDRVYIFENHKGELGELLTSQRFEWAADGIEPQIGDQDMQSLSYETDGFARWPEILGNNGVIRSHVKDLPAGERDFLTSKGILSVLIVPIFLGDEWWGFVGFDETKWEREWSPAEEDALRGAAGILGGAIERRRSERALNQSEARYLAILQDQTDKICRYTPDGKVTFANEAFWRYFGVSPAERPTYLIWTHVEKQDVEALRAKIDSLKPKNPTAVSRARSRRADGELRWQEWTERGIFDETGQLIEVQAVGRDVDEEVRLRKQLEENLVKMENQAMTDPLTGLLNRRAIMEHAEAEWQRAQREKRPLSLVLMDVDKLKEINDTYGHLAGDQALSKLAELMRAGTRRYDWVGRWGGDEFLLILPGTGAVEAGNLAERLRLKFKAGKTEVKGIHMNMSLGVASSSMADSSKDSLKELMARADRALYQAKQKGRGKVEVGK